MNELSNGLIVVADDEGSVVDLLERMISSWGLRCVGAPNKATLMAVLAKEAPCLLILDLHFGESNGLEILSELLETYPLLRIVLLTGQGTIADAVAAIKDGAYDFLTKPPDWSRLQMIVRHALEQQQLHQRIESLEESAGLKAARTMLGESRALRQVADLIDAVAPTDAPVLVYGESGTGKELAARAIHEKSNRPKEAFFAVNMAALPASLVESTLFGHDKGAFTGADKVRIGCFERADRGTLLLDEIGEMDLALQAKLLRFLQERTFERVGSNTTIAVDCRIIAATNRDLPEMIRLGTFREDLYYRLNVVPIWLPPLRERGDDILLLAHRFMRSASIRHRKDIRGMSDAVLNRLTKYRWPGNVRELENLIERMVILAKVGAEIGLETLPAEIREATAPGTFPDATLPSNAPVDSLPRLDDMERQAILEALEKAQGKVGVAAQYLGVGQATVYRKIKRYNIKLTNLGREASTDQPAD